jgi:hypothetical protein
MRVFPAAASLAVVLGAAAPGAARADGLALSLEPGLWERTTTMHVANAPPMPDLSTLPPEQRAHIEQMMAAMSGRPTTERECLTPEKLREWQSFVKDSGRKAQGCERKVLESTSKQVKMSMSCSQGAVTGTMELTAESPKHVLGSVHMRHTDPADAAHPMDVRYESRWLQSDCGDVQPGEPEPSPDR